MIVPKRTPVVRSARTVLRPFRSEDIDGRVRCGKDPEIIRMFGGSPAFSEPVSMPLDDATAWYDEVSTDSNPLHWAVETEGEFIGTARLHGLDETDRRARYAIGLLDRGRLGIGLGTEVTQAVLQYGFGTLGLHRIDLRVLAYNTRAIRCYLRCGFVEEGRERDAAYVQNKWHDDVIMGILEHEVRTP
ncbi:GNAT family N-acetyltransferase [Nocardioides mesophilus]|uniref:GNAT family N-acetyltransferase n=1 Tax=Nocardioides mesophilus TaxID=433659 RepID=A0A7G9R6R9_9ACTN|nr:GNAT family protein [Nocardioides mesophilus]QNN51294.1 GNAT family N-acetyltransferase [Nocardioides mesophilus]